VGTSKTSQWWPARTLLRYDNVRSINEELARFLYVLVTGERVGFRELYSDREAVYMGFKRAVFF
jgi:hypothetical protein